jgi:hypothetical protein
LSLDENKPEVFAHEVLKKTKPVPEKLAKSGTPHFWTFTATQFSRQRLRL